MKKQKYKMKAMVVPFVLVGGLVLSSCGTETTAENVIPEGCTYTVISTGETFEEGEPFPEELQAGDILYDYEAGYEYAYAAVAQIERELTEDGAEIIHYFSQREDMAGWCAIVNHYQQDVYGELMSEICGQPVVNLDYCFFGCENMKNVPAIPDTVTSMKGTFGWCSSLEEMPQLPEGLINMEGTFEQCVSLTEISNIPTTVKDLSYAFTECTALIEVGDIPEGVEDMQGTFNRCLALKTVGIIPESVTDLSYTFTGCKNLEGDMFIYANPEIYDRCFFGTEKQIFVFGNDNSDWALLGELCKTVESGWYDNVVMPG